MDLHSDKSGAGKVNPNRVQQKAPGMFKPSDEDQLKMKEEMKELS